MLGGNPLGFDGRREFGASEAVADDGGLGIIGAPTDDHAGRGRRLEVRPADNSRGCWEAENRGKCDCDGHDVTEVVIRRHW